jgi:SpoVK/Ycf46/Vps4 family AAA+-type ATPase
MRRVLNSFLQFIEQDTSDSLVIAATNNPQLLDQALFRRFDDVLYYKNPTDKEREQLIANRLGVFKSKKFSWKGILKKASGLSHAELALACNDAIKVAILANKKEISAIDLCKMIFNRQDSYQGIND